MFRRIEVINSYPLPDGSIDYFKHGLMGLSQDAITTAWIDKLRGSDRKLPHNAFFYFTEKGWREVGRAVLKACIASGQDYRVIRIKENEVDVVWRDKYTGFEVAAQPKRPRS
jgi:hypothetical protein